MTSLPVFALVVTCLAAIVQQTAAICCQANEAGGFCSDCTKKTPYCSYGKCNIFGCACAAECRKDCDPWVTITDRGWWESPEVTCECKNNGRRRDADDDEDQDVEDQEDEDQDVEDQEDQKRNRNPNKMFKAIDTDGDGYINMDEFSNAVPEYADINAAFDDMDANDDGKIGRKEFDPDLQ